MVERQTDWEIILIACIGTVLVMAGIYFIGIQLNDYKIDSLRGEVAELEVDHRSQALGLEVAETMGDDSCRAIQEWRESSIPELRDLRKEVETYEDSNKINNPEYETVKKRYTNLVLQSLVESRTMEQNCNGSVGEIIYIYDDSCLICEDQATVLTYYRRHYGNELVVYPLDAELGMKPVEFVEEFHNVTEYPALIIEGELHQGFKDKQELGEILDEKLETQD